MKYVLLTGCSGGIGKSTTLKLLDAGYYVFGLDVCENDITHPNFKFFCCDLTSKTSLESVFSIISKITNHLSAIYNLAGIFKIQSLLEGSEEDLRKIIEINFFAVYRLNKLFTSLLDKQSRIIVFSSEVARYSPQPFNGYYALSKIIVDRYADVLRREYNYLDIKVIKVQSGAIKTKLLDGVNDQYLSMVEKSMHYKKPLTKLKKLMDKEINKQVNPEVVANKLVGIMKKRKPKSLYKIKNSFSLRFLDSLPESLQDKIYKKVIR